MKTDDFDHYLDHLAAALAHVDRVGPMKEYCTGLMLPVPRKSVEPLAAQLDPRHVSAKHQSLLHFVGQSDWSDDAMLKQVRAWVQPLMARQAWDWFWIVDDTGTPKKGKHSVGVGRQYWGPTGKQDNCQVTVTLSLATALASIPIACRLYLPQAWCEDEQRRWTAGVPSQLTLPPSRRSRWSRYRRRRLPACRWGRWSPMPPTAMSARFAKNSKQWNWTMWWGLGRARAYGDRIAGRCRLNLIEAESRGQHNYSVARVTNRYRSRNWRWHCQPRHGVRSHGAKAPMLSCLPALQECGYGRRIGTTCDANPTRSLVTARMARR
jgi:hypothetical protein